MLVIRPFPPCFNCPLQCDEAARLVEMGHLNAVTKAYRDEESTRNRQRVQEIVDWVAANRAELHKLVTKDFIDEDGFDMDD